MKIKKFSRNEAIRFGWIKVKKNLILFISIMILTGFISVVTENSSDILILIGGILSLIISMGIIKTSIKITDNLNVRFRDFFSSSPLFLKYLISSIFYILMVYVGLFLLIIPGIILAIRFQFYAYFIIDKEIGPIDALKKSFSLTKGALWELFVFDLLLIGINIIGLFALIVGLFVTIPLTYLANAFVYRKLLNQTKLDNTIVEITENVEYNPIVIPAVEPEIIPIINKEMENRFNEETFVSDTTNDVIGIKIAFTYKGATIQYKVKVENPTPEPIADIKVTLYVPDVFLLSTSNKNIGMLKPGEGKTVTFDIRPTGECGDCEVSGKVVYYDYSSKKTCETEIPAKSLSIVCPMLHVKEISENEWHDAVSNLVKAEESTKDIDIAAETLFTMVSRIIKDMHMYAINPEITQSEQLFNGVARFYGEGVKGLQYAAEIEVIGGSKKSKLILKIMAEREEALTGFYHGVLDQIEKRVNVKEYIDNSIVQQYNIHYGDKIGTHVKDSVVQRSNIGADTKRKCPDCGKEAGDNEKFCNECGGKLIG
ncbi:MAG: DUF975 family protein [Candidatus Methanoperedenaceae archaeon]|nr:DUF975 family protein [Candidatus Methanoperedenaceae archaeon]